MAKPRASNLHTLTALSPVARPALAQWIWDRDLDWRDAAALFGLSHETLRRYCRPFDDPRRVVPDHETRVHIAEVTGWAVLPPSFDERVREAAA